MDINNRLFRYLNRNVLKALAIFWIFMIIVNVLAATIISYNLFPDVIFNTITINSESISLSNPSPGTMTLVENNIFGLVIFFIIYGIVIYYEYFSLAGSFGITRKNFYAQVILTNIIIVVASATIQILLTKIDNVLMSSLGYRPSLDYGIFNMNDNFLLNILILSFVFLVFISLGNLLGVLVYRFSYRFWIALGVAGFITGLFLRNLGRYVVAIAQVGFWAGLIIIFLSYSIGFLIFRRANIK